MRHFNLKNLDNLIRSALFIGSVHSYSLAMLNIFVHSIPYLTVAKGPYSTFGGRRRQEQPA